MCFCLAIQWSFLTNRETPIDILPGCNPGIPTASQADSARGASVGSWADAPRAGEVSPQAAKRCPRSNTLIAPSRSALFLYPHLDTRESRLRAPVVRRHMPARRACPTGMVRWHGKRPRRRVVEHGAKRPGASSVRRSSWKPYAGSRGVGYVRGDSRRLRLGLLPVMAKLLFAVLLEDIEMVNLRSNGKQRREARNG